MARPKRCTGLGVRRRAEFENAPWEACRTAVPIDSTLDDRRRPHGGVSVQPPSERVAAFDWLRIGEHLNEAGWAPLAHILTASECEALAALYARDDAFRSRVVMARHGFGRGEYKYFRYPLPGVLTELRAALYARLAPIADRWNELMGVDVRYPAEHADFLERCRRDGQASPTPLLLRYEAGDYNCLHQDLYGEHVFPLQTVFLLSSPETDFTGGELVLTEQRPRMQSRVEVVPLGKGDGAVFAVSRRPRRGSRGYHRVTMRHGASRIRSGRRFTAGLIFHDAR
jgi:uncharacterized protein